MDFEGWFFLPGVVTIDVILISWLVFCKLVKKRGIRTRSGSSAWSTTPSTSSSAIASGAKYEVFLSFRGADTRKGFADYLYTDLVAAQVHTFRDDNAMRRGEEISPELLTAIKNSKISIPIFSKNYASSKWCLRELAQMVECQKSMGHKIFPIFYNVKQSDVQNQTGSYAEAFSQHDGRFRDETIREWKDALRKVGGLKGWDLERDTDGYEGKLVKMIVREVLSRVNEG